LCCDLTSYIVIIKLSTTQTGRQRKKIKQK
jgi:hypothetical protein